MFSLRLLALAGLLIGVFIGPKVVFAEEVIAGSVYDQDKENQTVQAARRRAYAGGRDESDLVVQAQLPAPVRKMTPQSESVNDTSADDSF